MTDPSPYLMWITTRAAGTTAMVLASASVAVGLAMGSKLPFGRGPDRIAIHQTLSLAVLVAVAVHGLTLLGDTYLHPSVLDVTVPFAFSYRTLPTTIGIVAAWSLVLLGLSYYLRRWIGHRRWKLIHRFTVLAWIGALVHTFTEGTDAGQHWFIALIALTAAPAVCLLILRLRKRWYGAGPSHPRRRPVGTASARSSAVEEQRGSGRAGVFVAKPMDSRQLDRRHDRAAEERSQRIAGNVLPDLALLNPAFDDGADGRAD
jgi:methionine sulfoxide reductase heme-binding subunit